jgi:hypothetical protein
MRGAEVGQIDRQNQHGVNYSQITYFLHLTLNSYSKVLLFIVNIVRVYLQDVLFMVSHTQPESFKIENSVLY